MSLIAPAYSFSRLLITSLLSPQMRRLRPSREAPLAPNNEPRSRWRVARDSLIVSTVWKGRLSRSTCVGLPSQSSRTAIRCPPPRVRDSAYGSQRRWRMFARPDREG
jgi:hypothetical protein